VQSILLDRLANGVEVRSAAAGFALILAGHHIEDLSYAPLAAMRAWTMSGVFAAIH
jgi:hypothetical protein